MFPLRKNGTCVFRKRQGRNYAILLQYHKFYEHAFYKNYWRGIGRLWLYADGPELGLGRGTIYCPVTMSPTMESSPKSIVNLSTRLLCFNSWSVKINKQGSLPSSARFSWWSIVIPINGWFVSSGSRGIQAINLSQVIFWEYFKGKKWQPRCF